MPHCPQLEQLGNNDDALTPGAYGEDLIDRLITVNNRAVSISQTQNVHLWERQSISPAELYRTESLLAGAGETTQASVREFKLQLREKKFMALTTLT